MGSQASNTSYPSIACVVIGGGVGLGGGGGIPKSPSFHSSLELAEAATGRQIVSPENCNYFTFTTEMNNSDENPTATTTTSSSNGFVAKTIQNFTRFQNMTNNQQPQQQQSSNNFVDNENNDTNVSSIKSSLVGSVSNSITSRINSINDKLNNGPNVNVNLVKMPLQQQQQHHQANMMNISTTGDNNLLKPVAKGAVITGGSPSRARDRNNLNGGISPNSTVNPAIPLPMIKGGFLFQS